METNKDVPTSRWVDEHLGNLAPDAGWQPSMPRGLDRFRQRAAAMPKRAWPRGVAIATGTAVICLGLIGTLRAPRVFAQRCLDYCSEVLSLDRPKAIPAVGMTSSNPEEAGVLLTALDGMDVTLDHYKGKVVLVNFWATWCQPCRVEIPWLIEFDEKYRARGLVILGVAMDDGGSKAVAPWVTNQMFRVDGRPEAMNYKIVLGNEAVADKFGGILGLPTSFLYGRDGKRIKTIMGLLNHDDVQKAIESQLSKEVHS